MASEDQRQLFAHFVQAHWAQLMQVAVAVSGSRVDAEDLVQSALTSAYARWGKIDPERALGYLRRSIVNTHVSWWRRHRGAELSMNYAIDEPAPDWSAAVDERLMALQLLQRLPTRQRAVLVLRYVCDLSDAEIATTLQVRQSTVRSQATRALMTLRALIVPPASVPAAATNSVTWEYR